MIDLDALGAMHPRLPPGVAEALATGAAIALQRRHQPGVALQLQLSEGEVQEEVRWQRRSESDARMMDAKRATEDGAECIALAVAHQHRGWRLLRRLQSQSAEHGDWLLEDSATGRKIVLEISGTDVGSLERRVREKRGQAALAAAMGAPVASVVRFLEPSARQAELP
jgi:hypothetical protein